MFWRHKIKYAVPQSTPKGIKKVKAECIIIAIAHNLRKMNGVTEKEVAWRGYGKEAMVLYNKKVIVFVRYLIR